MLFSKLKYSPNIVILQLASLRFFYIHVLKRSWSVAETPYPKKVVRLPLIHGNRKRLMTLPADEFLRRFLLHLLPRGFVRIRNFGFLANRRRATLLPLCRQLLPVSAEDSPTATLRSSSQQQPLWRCPRCGGAMHFVERISAAWLLLRAPQTLTKHGTAGPDFARLKNSGFWTR